MKLSAFFALLVMTLTGCSGDAPSSDGTSVAPSSAPAPGPGSAPIAAQPIDRGPNVQPVGLGSQGGYTPPPAEPEEGPPAGLNASQCSEIADGGPNDGCVTGEIHCGETVVGHTRGGITHFDTKFYEKKFCTPSTTHHNEGDERVYKFQAPDGDFMATVYLDTPCTDLDMAAFKWDGQGCPTVSDAVGNCEMWPKDGSAREKVILTSQRPTQWYVVVEGKDGAAEGPFSLTVECKNSLY